MISWVTNVLTKLQTDKAKRSLESVSNLTPLFCSKYSDLLFQVTRNNIQYFRQPNNSSSNKRQSHWWLRMFDHPQYVQFYSFCMLKKTRLSLVVNLLLRNSWNMSNWKQFWRTWEQSDILKPYFRSFLNSF